MISLDKEIQFLSIFLVNLLTLFFIISRNDEDNKNYNFNINMNYIVIIFNYNKMNSTYKIYF